MHETQAHETLNGRTKEFGETAEQLRKRLGIEERTFQARWNTRIGPYSKHRICTTEEAQIMEAGSSRLVFDEPQITKATEPDKQQDAPAKIAAGETIRPKRSPTPRQQPQTQARPQPSKRQWALWVVMACGLLTSVPNMYAMTLAIKEGDWRTAGGVTAAFTLAPAFLLWAGAREWYARACIVLVIGYEVFCNAASFYGGLTGLNHSTFVDPTNFLHMATGFAFDSEYEATARAISVFMATGIAALVAIPVIKVAKSHV